MGGHRTISGSTNPFVPQPIANYNVAGSLTPDSKGNYWDNGVFAGKTCYRRQDNSWFLWWDIILMEQHISRVLGYDGLYFWAKPFEGVPGVYLPGGLATGIATVKSGPA